MTTLDVEDYKSNQSSKIHDDKIEIGGVRATEFDTNVKNVEPVIPVLDQTIVPPNESNNPQESTTNSSVRAEGTLSSSDKASLENSFVEFSFAGEEDDVTEVESMKAFDSNKSTNKQNNQNAYNDNEEHLWHILSLADSWLRVQMIRWQNTVAVTTAQQYWGMVHVSPEEINTFLAMPFMRNDELPTEVINAMQPSIEVANKLADKVSNKTEQTSSTVKLRLLELKHRFNLNQLEVDVLAICMLAELDNRYRRLFGFLQDDATRVRPSVELIKQILQNVSRSPGNIRNLFNAKSTLASHHIVSLAEPVTPSEPLVARQVKVDQRIVDYLQGSNQQDSRLKNIIHEPDRALDWSHLILPKDQKEYLQTLTEWLQSSSEASEAPPTFFMHGSYGNGQLESARVMTNKLHTSLLIIDTSAVLRSPEGWSTIVDLIYREAKLRSVSLYWTNTQIIRENEKYEGEWDYLIAASEKHTGIIFIESEKAWDPAGYYRQKPFIRIAYIAPNYDMRLELWQANLPNEDQFAQDILHRKELTETLSNGFQLTGGQIIDAIATAKGEAMRRDPGEPKIDLEDLYEGCRRQSSRRLVTFAKLIEPRKGISIDQLILPDANDRQLKELRDRISYRSKVYTGMGFEKRLNLGKGIIVVFAGSSGTGKTMAAELLAHEYGTQLYKVDLSAVVSKYVGETEKNLARVFDEAEDANAILLFDEGESLFGKRGEVKEAKDRWANLEASFLLQRVEEYRGIVIITTNRRQDIEPAFWRRIDTAVEFPRPDAKARLAIWQGMFPEGVNKPAEEELTMLANKFGLSGGNIKNAAVDAAFRALSESEETDPQITIRHIVLGIAREEQKQGRALTKGDFGEEYYNWITESIL